jgi:hypothetical protein
MTKENSKLGSRSLIRSKHPRMTSQSEHKLPSLQSRMYAFSAAILFFAISHKCKSSTSSISFTYIPKSHPTRAQYLRRCFFAPPTSSYPRPPQPDRRRMSSVERKSSNDMVNSFVNSDRATIGAYPFQPCYPLHRVRTRCLCSKPSILAHESSIV